MASAAAFCKLVEATEVGGAWPRRPRRPAHLRAWPGAVKCSSSRAKRASSCQLSAPLPPPPPND
eukprot:7280883-Pyramimonas_sp.AAC.1